MMAGAVAAPQVEKVKTIVKTLALACFSFDTRGWQTVAHELNSGPSPPREILGGGCMWRASVHAGFCLPGRWRSA